MTNPISPIPRYPIFVWPAPFAQLDFRWTPSVGSVVDASVPAGNYALIADYTGATVLTAQILTSLAAMPITACAVTFVSDEPRLSFTFSAAGSFRVNSGSVRYVGAALTSTSASFNVTAGGTATMPYCPFGYWQPLSHTPWYERHNTAQAFVSESIGGGFRYRTEWGVKQSAVFSASNVRRGVIYRDAVNVKGSGTPIDGSFSAAAGKAVGDDNNTLEGMIDAARSVDILTLLAGNYSAGVSIINTDILSDFETILAETDGKRMYDVSLPLRHIGFG
jgi:hypothetical protein